MNVLDKSPNLLFWSILASLNTWYTAHLQSQVFFFQCVLGPRISEKTPHRSLFFQVCAATLVHSTIYWKWAKHAAGGCSLLTLVSYWVMKGRCQTFFRIHFPPEIPRKCRICLLRSLSLPTMLLGKQKAKLTRFFSFYVACVIWQRVRPGKDNLK